MIKKLQTAFRFAAVASATLMLTACPTKPTADYTAALKQAIGDEVKGYQALSYPTNSFGIATTFTAAEPGKPVSDGDFLCATWKCLGAPGGTLPTNPDQALNVTVRGTNYAEIGKGGPVKLDTDSANDYAFKVALPKIQQILNLGVGLNDKSATKVELEFGAATKRYLSKPDFIAYVNSLDNASPTKAQLQKAFAQGALVVVVADVVIDSIKATVTASNELAPELNLKLGGVASKVFSDAEASFKVTKKDSATYVIESVGPVVALRLLKAQPGAGLLGDEKTWSDWAVVTGPTGPVKEKP